MIEQQCERCRGVSTHGRRTYARTGIMRGRQGPNSGQVDGRATRPNPPRRATAAQAEKDTDVATAHHHARGRLGIHAGDLAAAVDLSYSCRAGSAARRRDAGRRSAGHRALWLAPAHHHERSFPALARASRPAPRVSDQPFAGRRIHRSRRPQPRHRDDPRFLEPDRQGSHAGLDPGCARRHFADDVRRRPPRAGRGVQAGRGDSGEPVGCAPVSRRLCGESLLAAQILGFRPDPEALCTADRRRRRTVADRSTPRHRSG